MEIADGRGEGICCIRGNWVGEMKERANHFLHLQFAGMTVTDHRLLDNNRGVFLEVNAVFSRSQHGHPAGLSQLQCALCVTSEEDLFQANGLWPVT